MTSGITLGLLGIVVAGAAVGGGLALLVLALVPRPVQQAAPSGTGLADDLRRLGVAAGRRVPVAIGAALLVLVVTRWVVLAVAVAVIVLVWDQLFGGAKEEQRAMDRLEGLATWIESLRDTIAGAVGLEQAIPATAHAASPAVRPALMTLANRLAVRTPLVSALKRFADELADPSVDLTVAALMLNARLRGPGLKDVLSSLAVSTREELDMRRRIAAQRRSTRRSVQIIMLVTVGFVLLLRVVNPGYLAPYGSVLGQVVLLVIIGLFAAGFWWMRRLSAYDLPGRFLQGDASPAPRVAR
ncbi:type II secretion system F family protein [Thalassiella azotivora]